MQAKSTLALEVTFEGRTRRIESTGTKFKVGRSPLCDIPLPNVHVISREHLIIEIKAGEVWISDLNSSNGTYYQDLRIVPQVPHRYTGDVFYLGSVAEGVRIKVLSPVLSEDRTIAIIEPIEIKEPSLTINLTDQAADAALALAKREIHPPQAKFADTNHGEVKFADAMPVTVRLPEVPPVEVKLPEPKLPEIKAPLKPTLDENLLQMQFIEEELAELTKKREHLSQEIDELAKKDEDYKRLEREYQTHQASLVLLKEEIHSLQSGMEKRRSDLAQLDTEFNATDAQLKSHTALAETKRIELEEKLTLLRARKAEVNEANEQFESLKSHAELKVADIEVLAQRILQLEQRSRDIATEHEKYIEVRAQHEAQANEIEGKIIALEAERIDTEKNHLLQCENERAGAAELIFFKAEAEAANRLSQAESKSGIEKAKFEYAQEQVRIRLELDGVEAAASLRKAVLEREAEEVLTRKIIAGRELEDLKRLMIEEQKTCDQLKSEQQKTVSSIASHEAKLLTLRENIREIELQKDQCQLELIKLKERNSEVEREIEEVLNQANDAAKETLAQAEKQKIQLQNETELWIAGRKLELSLEEETLKSVYDQKRKDLEVGHESELAAFKAKFADAEIEHLQKLKLLEQEQLNLEAGQTARILEFEQQRTHIEIEHAALDAEFNKTRAQAILELDEKIKHGTAALENEQLAARRTVEALEVEFEEKRLGFETEQARAFAAFEEKKRVTELEQADQNRLFAVQFEEATKRAHQAHDATVISLKEAATELRNQQAEEMRIWSAHEESRIKTVAAKNATAFAHHVAMRSLAEYQNDSSVSVSALIATLEKKIVEALNGQVQGEGIYNPDFKKGVRKFWIQAGAGAAALIALAFGVQYGPQILGNKLNNLKVANQQEDARFMLEVKLQRDRMLALNLQAKDSFQEFYVDNILYNPGYLAMKLDPEIQKKWTVVLSKFFFDELLFDDRKVVDFIPIEASLMAGMNEIFKILNSQNFEVNLVHMKKLEQEKSEAMWLLVGGKENWTKLRKKEADFYQQHASAAIKAGRIPASP